MRGVERNKKPLCYALYVGETPILDSDGNETGDYAVTYGTPVPLRASISASRGSADIEQFGVNLNYSKTIKVFDMACPIAETTVLWIDQTDVSKAPDYRVVGVAKGLTSITYAIRKVKSDE